MSNHHDDDPKSSPPGGGRRHGDDAGYDDGRFDEDDMGSLAEDGADDDARFGDRDEGSAYDDDAYADADDTAGAPARFDDGDDEIDLSDSDVVSADDDGGAAGDEYHADDHYDDDDGDDDEAHVAPAPLTANRREPEAKPQRAAKERRPAAGSGWGGAVIRFFGLLFAIGVLGVVTVAGVSVWYLGELNKNLPDYQQLAEYAPPVTTRVYAGDGSLVAEFARERRLFVPIEAMPDHVKYAFVSAEDKSFYDHNGLDLRGLVRAQLSNVGNILRGRRLEGGSTITQQVAKNFLLTSEQKIERKLREMLIARKMERAFTKDHILELYLNEIYLGNRSYGVAAAALNYFDKSLDELTIAEAAYIAALTKGPSNYHPVENEARAIERRNWVIGRLYDDGHITAEAAEEAKAQPLGAQIAPPLGARDWTMEYFAEEVRKQIADLYGVEALYDGGLSVRTTVDPRLQREAGAALRRWLVEYDRRHGWRGAIATIEAGDDWPETFKAAAKELNDQRKTSDDMAPWRVALVLSASEKSATIGFDDGTEGSIPLDEVVWAREYISANDLGPEVTSVASVLKRGDVVYAEAIEGRDGVYALRQAPAVNGGLIAMDPHTGRVLAMVGGFSFQLSEFNRAVQAERQPGSTFKPFVYSVALDSGYTPSSIVLDAPFVAPSNDSWYKPGNYIAGRWYGPSTLRLGIEQSRNAMTARLAQDLGIGRIIDYVSRFNLADSLPRELAISLGAGETTLMRITAGYSVFVNGGKRVEPVLIDRVQDRTGKTIYRRDARDCLDCNAPGWTGQAEPQLADLRTQIIDPRTAYQITSILEGVIVRGTGSAVRKVADKPLAGKTGTTNDYKDAWFVGFSPDLAAGVYVGFDMPQTLGQGEAGGTVAAPIFGDFMVDALADKAGIPFRVPSGIRLVRVNAKTGRPAGAGDGNVILEAFKAEQSIEGRSLLDDEYVLDPLSAAPRAEDAEDDLNGLY